MNFKNKTGWIVIIPAIIIVLLVLAGALHMTRVDVIAACNCTKELFHGKQAEIDVVRQNKQIISQEAKRFDLPPELLAAIIYNHQRDLTPFRVFTDCFGSALGRNLSLAFSKERIVPPASLP
ncbi:MAG: hypothetical protein P8Z37_17190 [Acidobacteriota bacterium]